MTGPADWTKSTVIRKRAGAEFHLPRFERADGLWRVEETTYNCARPFFVMAGYGSATHWSCTSRFRSRFATPEAAMAAIDRRFPLGAAA